MSNTKLTSSLLVAMFLLTLLTPFVSQVSAADPAGTYFSVAGNLYSDDYNLYPFAQKSLDIGFSKYGEMINAEKLLGLQYGGYDSVGTYDQSTGTSRDPFANELVNQAFWVNGWVLNVTYRNPLYSVTGNLAYRNVWAEALYADGQAIGGDWVRVSTPQIGVGGRQTNKVAWTDDPKVLYDGPREYIVTLTTHINDSEGANSWRLCDVMFTVIFEKVKKEVIVFKEVKLKLETKALEGLVDVQLSNRGEWDLGPSSGTNKLKSYAHFYWDAGSTAYDNNWHYKDQLAHDVVETFTGDGSTKDFLLNCTVQYNELMESPQNIILQTEHVFVNQQYKLLGASKDYTIYVDGNGRGHLLFNLAPTSGQKIVIYYKNYDGKLTGTYSLAQIISADSAVVGFAAFWPRLSDYSVDGWDKRQTSLLAGLTGVREADCSIEPKIPFVIGEWDFTLNVDEQFRGVTVYGVTDYHDAKDSEMAGNPANVIDREVQYQLDEVFNPWDLYSAVEKKNDRWVQWSNGLSTVTLSKTPGLYVPDSEWDQYCTFSERVEKPDGTLLHRIANDPTYGGSKDYSVSYNTATGVMTLTGLPSGVNCKILYSTSRSWFSSASWTQTFDYLNMSYTPGNVVTLLSTDWSPTDIVDPMGATWSAFLDDLNLRFVEIPNGSSMNFQFMVHNNFNSFKVFKEDTAILRAPAWVYPQQNVTSDGITVMLDLWRAIYEITAPRVDIHVDWFHPDLQISGSISTNATAYNATFSVTIAGESGYPEYPSGYLYEEHVGGRYEWVVVGRDAATVDSAGAALVAAAFKNKQVEIGLAGADMWNPVITDQMPWVMSKFGAGNTKDDYMDLGGVDFAGGDNRAEVRDDWCSLGSVSGDEVPIATSNMIAVGGPLANVLAWYANDFTNAFYGNPIFTPDPKWSGDLAAIACWNKNSYESSNSVGYAIVSTYKDINGTVLFVIYGHWGRDTYYATKWFHEDGIFEFQTFPAGATSIILKISYESTAEGYKPTAYKVLEILGTISEHREIYDPRATALTNMYKGGLHPDP